MTIGSPYSACEITDGLFDGSLVELLWGVAGLSNYTLGTRNFWRYSVGVCPRLLRKSRDSSMFPW